MFQFSMSVNSLQKEWLSGMEKVLELRVKGVNGLMAVKESDGRYNVSIACESKNKTEISNVIKDSIVEIFLSVVKKDYLKKLLKLSTVKPDSYKLLLHTLVAFDRDAEKEIILCNLKLSDTLALDGLFNFRLFELRKRWNDIAELAINNASYLNDDETLNELIRFLMSSISPKIKKLEVERHKNRYNVLGEYMEKNFRYCLASPEQLILYLINVAPLELVLKGDFEDDKLYKRLLCIFDAKSVGE